MSETARPARRVRRRTLRRWVTPGLAIATLLASMVMVVRRGEVGRRLSAELEALEAQGSVASDRIVAERARVDSLTTLTRIEDVAGSIGLRRAVDAELVQVEAVDRDLGNEVALSGVGRVR